MARPDVRTPIMVATACVLVLPIYVSVIILVVNLEATCVPWSESDACDVNKLPVVPWSESDACDVNKLPAYRGVRKS